MEYRFLGRTGLKVSELCLGAMTFGREADEVTSHALLNRFAEVGGTFIDTADVYSRGVSEEILGRWLKTVDRDQFAVATKVRWPMSDDLNDVGLNRKHIVAAVEASLRRLGTDYLDLYQVHAWDGATPLTETLSTLNDLVRAGKVRYLGASNYSGWQLQKAVDLSERHGWEQFRCLQPLYNLIERDVEWELLPVCRNEGLGVIPWSPLQGGWLSGKVRRGMTGPPAGTRLATAEERGLNERWSAQDNERTWRVLDELFAVAEDAGKTPAQVALRWLMQRPGVTAPIIGARSLEQLDTNLGALGWKLPAEHVTRLDEVSAKPLPYPYVFITADPERA